MTAGRVLIGVVLLYLRWDQTIGVRSVEDMELTIAPSHIPFPHASALLVSLVEFACGAGLAFGLLTPVCAVVCSWS